MKKYYRVMLGRGGNLFEVCHEGNFIGVDYGIRQDLSNILSDDWRKFNHSYIPIYLDTHQDKTKIAAGLAGGATHTVCRGIQEDHLILSPDGLGNYYMCQTIGSYEYHPEGILPHRRPVHWLHQTISRDEMSDALKHSTGAAGTVVDISSYANEIEKLLGETPSIFAVDETIEDPSQFAMEKHLEDFLVTNWKRTPFGKDYVIFEEDGEPVGQQYRSDTGAMDILAVSKDQKTLLVIELKKGRASDAVVGQILRYMGFVREELTEPNQQVKGVIIAMEEDISIQRALSMVNNIDFYRYEVSFKLKKV